MKIKYKILENLMKNLKIYCKFRKFNENLERFMNI